MHIVNINAVVNTNQIIVMALMLFRIVAIITVAFNMATIRNSLPPVARHSFNF